MKRDMDLVRRILLDVESAPREVSLGDFDYEGKAENEVGYHIELLVHHGLIDASVKKDWGGDYILATVNGLTWDGYDYLDAIRDTKVWTKTKKVIKETVGSTTMAIIKETASAIARQTILSSLGM